MVKANCSTLQCNIKQQSATQGSNDMAHTLSRRTAATTRFSTEGCRLPETDGAKFCQQSDHVGLYLASIHQIAPPKKGSTHLIIALLLIYRPQNDERLSWPSWLTCSGRFTHISGHPLAAGQMQDRDSSPAKHRRSITVLRNQPIIPTSFLTISRQLNKTRNS